MIRTGSRSLLVALLACLFLAACSDSPTEPSGPVLGQSLTLRSGQSVTLRGEPVTIRFQTILSDSRCPINAICVWAGEARGKFSLAVGARSPEEFELSTLEPQSVQTSGYTVTLEFVLPANAGTPIPPGEYVASLRISR